VYITEDRARDLVYVQLNLRLLKNIQAVNYGETNVEREHGLLLILTPNNTDYGRPM